MTVAFQQEYTPCQTAKNGSGMVRETQQHIQGVDFASKIPRSQPNRDKLV